MLKRWKNRRRVISEAEVGYEDGNGALKKLDGRNAHPMTFDEYLNWYSVHKNYLNHENDLINYRVGWVLSLHGFLYASYALVLTTQMTALFSAKNIFLHHRFNPVQAAQCGLLSQSEMFLLGISVIGMAISVAGLAGARLAQKSMKNVARSFRVQNRVRVLYRERGFSGQEEGVPHYKYTKRPIRYLIRDGFFLPGLTGGGSKHVSRWGSYSSIAIPFALAMGWFISFFVLLNSASKNLEFACGYGVGQMIKIYSWHYL